MAPDWLPEDGLDTEDPSTAFNDDHMADADPVTDDRPENVEENLTEENQTTGAGEAETEEHDAEEPTLPPRRFSADPEHKMQPPQGFMRRPYYGQSGNAAHWRDVGPHVDSLRGVG